MGLHSTPEHLDRQGQAGQHLHQAVHAALNGRSKRSLRVARRPRPSPICQ